MEKFFDFCFKLTLVRNRTDLLKTIKENIDNLTGFCDFAIFHGVKVNNPKLEFTVLTGTNPSSVNDRLTDIALPILLKFDDSKSVEEPVIWNMSELSKQAQNSGILADWTSKKISHIVGVKLERFTERSDYIFFAGNPKSTITNDLLLLLQKVSCQISGAITVALDAEKAMQREKEKEALLSLSVATASIRDQAEFHKVIQRELKSILNFDDLVVAMVNKDNLTQHLFYNPSLIKNSLAGRSKNETRDACSLADGIVDQVLSSPSPLTWHIPDVITWAKTPWYVSFWADQQMNSMIGCRVLSKGEPIGAIFFYAKNAQAFQPGKFNLISAIAQQLSLAILNIIANEDIRKRTIEKELLLDLGDLFSVVRSKEKLGQIIDSQLKKLLGFSNYTISSINKAQSTHNYYLAGGEGETDNANQGLDNIVSPINDGFFNTAVNLSEAASYSLNELIGLKTVPVYLSMWHEAGIRSLVTVPLYRNNTVSDLLILMYQKDNLPAEKQLPLINSISKQLAGAIGNIRAIEEVEYRDFQKQVLLSLSNDIAAIRNKKSLLSVLHGKLKMLLPFNDIHITCFNQSQQVHYSFIYAHEESRKNHPGFDTLIQSQHPVNDGIFNVVMSTDDPVIFNINKLSANGAQPAYIKLLKQSGIRELVGVSLRNGSEDIGVLFLAAEKTGTYSSQHIDLIRSISSQLCIAVANILANDEIIRHETEKSVFLKLSNDLAVVRNKQQLIAVLKEKVANLLPFLEISVMLYQSEQNAYQLFVKSNSHDGEPSAVKIWPVKDGVMNRVIAVEQPVLFEIGDLIHQASYPAYITYYQQKGVKEFTGVSLRNSEGIVGALFFYAAEINTYDRNKLNLIRGIADQLSFTITQILANEEILKRENEKAILLKISNDMAAIRNKEDLLGMLHEQLAQVCHFSHTIIPLINHERQTYFGFLFDPNARSFKHPDNSLIHHKEYPLNDTLMKKVLSGINPTVFDLDELVLMVDIPDYIRMHHQLGLKEVVFVTLYSANGPIGFFVLYADQKNGFQDAELAFIRAISYQLSTAVANIVANEELLHKERDKSILLEMSNAMALVRNKSDLRQFINQKLRKIIPFTHIYAGKMDHNEKLINTFWQDADPSVNDDASYNDKEEETFLLDEQLTQLVFRSNKPLVLNLDELSRNFDIPGLIKLNHDAGMKELIITPLGDYQNKIGVLALFFEMEHEITENHLNLIQGISSQLSIAITNILAHQDILKREDEKTSLLSFSNSIAAVRGKVSLAKAITDGLKNLFKIDAYILSVINSNNLTHSYFLFDLNAKYIQHPDFEGMRDTAYPIKGGLAEVVLKTGGPVTFDVDKILADKSINFSNASFWMSLGFHSIMGVPLKVANKEIGILWMHLKEVNLPLIQSIAAQIAIALATTLANEQIERQVSEITIYKQQLEIENLYLQEEIETTHNYSEIIGGSPVMNNLFKMVAQVAQTPSSVLILGETGTGKELIARAIHNNSLRRDKLMVKINCATLPPNLIESELFGHERGSFTGATDRRIGKFELANNGTLFLDEIGELPIDLQVKLLRALQEKEIERVGGRTIIKTDVRIIAATNRNLQKEVQLGNFRGDLYFRLNVFPLAIPPLRDRKEDVNLLATHFLQKHAKKSGKKVIGFSSKVIKQLNAYDWPGNVRELEHLIERSILLTTKPVINQVLLPSAEKGEIDIFSPGTRIKSIDEVEREHILYVLRRCNGKVSGVGGAAEVLNIPSTTLGSKIKRLGITKEFTSD